MVCTGTAMLVLKDQKSVCTSWWIAAAPSLPCVPISASLVPLDPGRFPRNPWSCPQAGKYKVNVRPRGGSKDLAPAPRLPRRCVSLSSCCSSPPAWSMEYRAGYCSTSPGLLGMNEKITPQLINVAAIWDHIRNAVEA